jgi:hypothetical protein
MRSKNSLERVSTNASRAEIHRLLGQGLKAYYDPMEPMPDRLAELLKQISDLDHDGCRIAA